MVVVLSTLVCTFPFINQEDNMIELNNDETSEAAQSFKSAKILCDESHSRNASDMWTPGNASMFGWLLGEYNYTVSNNWNSALDSGIINDYDVICLFFPMIPLSESEVNAIHNFVSSGGGLLLVGVESATDWDYTPSNLNPISEEYGITFNSDRIIGRSLRDDDDISNHFITQNVSSLQTKCDQISGCSLTIQTPSEALAFYDDKAILAAAEIDTGRVVAVGSLAPFMQYRHETWQENPNDHFQFSLNVIDWLVGNEYRIADPPDMAIIKVGRGPSLNKSELDEYNLYNGVFHDHTTYSDGLNTPLDMMTRALEVSLDWFVVSDHSYDRAARNGIYGALKAKEYEERYGFDCKVFVGAELSSIPHSVGFPLTDQIYTTNTQTAVDEIHAQGAMAVFSHPTIGFAYAPVWENFDAYGYDAFEVTNRGYFHGLGETAYFRPFIGSCDGHSAANLGKVRNVVFVKNPTGPEDSISVWDLIDAISEKRIVVLDLYNGVVFGQEIWVNRYLEVWEEAELAIDNATDQIEILETSGMNYGYSRMCLEKAQVALSYWNPSAALRSASDAVSDTVLGLDLIATTPNLGVSEPKSEVVIMLNFTNRHDYGVHFNCTPFINKALSFEQSHILTDVAPHSSSIITFTANAEYFGYMKARFILKLVNGINTPDPIYLNLGGMIANITINTETVGNQRNVTIRLLDNSLYPRMISSITMNYDDGNMEDTIALDNYGDSYGIELGPYPIGTNITYRITVVDVYGTIFELDSGSYVISYGEGGALTDIFVSAIIGVVLTVVLIIALMAAKRRR